jgi:pimeloyl-ACP methyl ester carboxylesterase
MLSRRTFSQTLALDGNFPATDETSSAQHFTGPRVHHQVPAAGHNLPQENPKAFAAAVQEVANLR